MAKTELMLAALFAFYRRSLQPLTRRNPRDVSDLSHHQVINAGADDRHAKVGGSLPVFLSNGVHNLILLKAYSND